MATADGRVPFEAGEKSLILHMTVNRLCLLEEQSGKTPIEIATELQYNPRISLVRSIFWAGLAEGSRTLEQAGDLIAEVGIPRAIALAKDAFLAAFPVAAKGKDDADHPPQPAAG